MSQKRRSREVKVTILPSATTPGGQIVRVGLAGTWKLTEGLERLETYEAAAKGVPAGTRVVAIDFDCSELVEGDSSLICFLVKIASWAREHNVAFETKNLPAEILKLFKLATTSGKYEPPTVKHSAGLFCHIGAWTEAQCVDFVRALDFLGRTFVAFCKFLCGRAQMRSRDLLYFIQTTSVDALPIITLISFITGVILAFIGAMQLQRFGATIYVANGIAIAMVREMGVVMAGVIMCGRTGAAFAAQIGAMQSSEEISALRVLGIDPVEYLVLPRILALTLMLPLLTIYANTVGIAGGLFVMGGMDITIEQFWEQVVATLNMRHVVSGLIKSVVFGYLVAWAGCYRGMYAGKNSLAVGEAATSAAVLGMVLLCVGDGIFAVIYNAFDF